MERLLKVQIVKFAGPGLKFDVTRKDEKCEKRRTTEAESVLVSEQQEESRLGADAAGVLLASREVQGRMIG